MTDPEDQNGLREALARELIRAKFGEEGVSVLFGIPAEATAHQVAALTARVNEARSDADALIAGPLASLIVDRASLRAAEAEITRLKEWMEAATTRQSKIDFFGLALHSLDAGAPGMKPVVRDAIARNIALRIRSALSPKEQP